MANSVVIRQFSQRDTSCVPDGVTPNDTAWSQLTSSMPDGGVIEVAGGDYRMTTVPVVGERFRLVGEGCDRSRFITKGTMGIFIAFPGTGYPLDGGGAIIEHMGFYHLRNAGVVPTFNDFVETWRPGRTVIVGGIYKPVKLANFKTNLDANVPTDYGWSWRVVSINGNTTPGFSGTTGATEPAWRNENAKLGTIASPLSMATINETGGGATGTIVWEPIYAHGIEVNRLAEIRNCKVMGFPGAALNINASGLGYEDSVPFTGYPGTSSCNANNFYISRCEFLYNGIGILVNHSDANNGLIFGCNVTGNRGAGVEDRSWLGNQYVGSCHIDQNGRGFVSNSSSFEGDYAEDNSPPHEITGTAQANCRNATWYSGTNFNRTIQAWHTPWTPAVGDWMTLPVDDGFEYTCVTSGAVGGAAPTGKPFIDIEHLYVTVGDTYGKVTDGAAEWRAFGVRKASNNIRLPGNRAFQTTYLHPIDIDMHFSPGGVPGTNSSSYAYGSTLDTGNLGPWRSYWDNSAKVQWTEHDANTGRRALGLAGTGCTIASVGSPILGRGYYDASGRYFGWASAIPAGGRPDGSNWVVGSRLFHSSPSVGNPKGWICTVAGAPGTWVSEGNL